VASIAHRYRVSLANVAEWNDVTNHAFARGYQVVVPAGTRRVQDRAVGAAPLARDATVVTSVWRRRREDQHRDPRGRTDPMAAKARGTSTSPEIAGKAERSCARSAAARPSRRSRHAAGVGLLRL
jgi:hypothetical protein